MFDGLIPLEPVHFFAFQMDCHAVTDGKIGKMHLLPDLSSLLSEPPFAKVFLGWENKGIHARVEVQGDFSKAFFPNFASGDSIELLFDTRDVKTTGFTTRFCHHFYFLPEIFVTNGDSVQAGEITRFRTDDVHELCKSENLKVRTKKDKKQTIIDIFIPSDCLHGYDPSQFDRLGFSYRLNRANSQIQYFSASGSDFSIESQPSLWASLKLIK